MAFNNAEDDNEDNVETQALPLRPFSYSFGRSVGARDGDDSGLPSIGERIVQMGRQQGTGQSTPEATSTLRWLDGHAQRVFTSDFNGPRQITNKPGVGERILGIKAFASHEPQLASLSQPSASNWRSDHPQQQKSFSTFIPPSADPTSQFGRIGQRPISPFGPGRRQSYFPGPADQGDGAQADRQLESGQTDNTTLRDKPIVELKDQRNAVSRIPKQSFGRSRIPPRVRLDKTQQRRTINRLMAGIRGPAMTPMGIAPDGAPMLDITSQVKAPPRIPYQYESGDRFSNVNIALIKRNESGTRREGYVPPDRSGRSGVTIAAGFDVGQHSLAELRGFGLPENIVHKLSPYAGLKGQHARDALAKTPVSITAPEAGQINEAVLNSKLNAAGKAFDDQNHRPGEFTKLPWQAQTVIADLWYNMGDLRDPKVAHVLWRQVTTGDWEGAYRNLRNFSQRDPTLAARARRDAKLLRDAIDAGKLTDY